MEMPASNRTRLLCLYGFLVTCILFSQINADGKIRLVTDPTRNVNLSPFQQWISAYECLQNKSQSCFINSTDYTLTEKGWLNVTGPDGAGFCKPGGCKDHTEAVLTCIHEVKRDYMFQNKATLWDLNFTIHDGCTFGFDGTTYVSDAGTIVKSGITFLISILATLFLLMHFYD
ncbi:hypothetical protein COLO4_19482 [Corchorus olitorius]|uniref:DUF7731 domain-containing protein n=1 Tax=Corchorus olitorius TaxID=93759 RepID=A0A1R3J555_9ROSI|nr:hypothetical protein COLO4_19482 [Corchorus olitorius]